MAEQVQRYQQYEYRANSNLVLTTDQHRPRTDEPSGEPESLKDFLDGTKFGDRVHFGKPDIMEAGRKRKADKNATAVKKGRKDLDAQNVLGLAEDIDSYRPRSKETRSAYEVGFPARLGCIARAYRLRRERPTGTPGVGNAPVAGTFATK